MKRFIWILPVVLLLAVLRVDRVMAQQPTPSDDQVNAIASQLFCPICQNTPLDVCPTQACHDWRELIRQMLAEGKTPDQIKQYFVDHYGAQVLAEPPRTGINWLVYVVPPAVFLIGVYFLFRAFRTWQKLSKEPAGNMAVDVKPVNSSRSAQEDEYQARLEEELRKRK
jgi:cytochrome c-type biogenesis protein CcmH